MRRWLHLIAIAAAVCLILSLIGCAQPAQTAKVGEIPENPDPWEAYAEPVAVKLAVPTANGMEWPGDVTGDYSYEDNVWTQSWLEEFNIKADVIWEANEATGAYETRMALSIVSGDLPDLILASDFSQFIKLHRSGRLREVGPYLEAYGYDLLKKYFYEGDRSIGYLDGKLYGVGSDNRDMRTREVFIRADWMEQLNLSAPETMDDVINIGKTFVDRGLATYALPLYNELDNGFGDMQAVANSVGAYPRIWYEQDGQMVYGSIQPAMKQTLGIYRDLINQGYIDSSFSSLDSGGLAMQITRGQIGVLPSDYWVISYPLADLWTGESGEHTGINVDWNIYPIMPMSDFEGDFKVQGGTIKSKIACINANYAHPEVFVKLLNFTLAKLDDPERNETNLFHSTTINEESYQFFNMNPFYVIINDPLVNYNTQTNVTAAIDNGFDKSYLKTAHDKSQYDKLRNWFYDAESGALAGPAVWSVYKMFYGDNSAFGIYNYYRKNNEYIFDESNGFMTDTMVRRWGTLISFEDLYVTKILAGKLPLDEGFDEFVQEWLTNGGETITEEMNEWKQASNTN